MIDARQIEAEILARTTACGPGRSICPTEVARALDGEWRPLTAGVRQAAVSLARTGHIDILRKGKPIDPAAMHGVIRLRAKASAP